MGGDEYVVVLSKCGKETLQALAEEIRVRIENSVLECENEGDSPVILDRRVTASIGVACLSQLQQEGQSVESLRQRLLRLADVAMYGAKAQGKNCIYWSPEEAPARHS